MCLYYKTARFANICAQIEQIQCMSNFHPLGVVDRVSETQPQVVENINKLPWQDKGWNINPPWIDTEG